MSTAADCAKASLAAAIAALKAQGAERREPTRLRYIEALARRAHDLAPAVRHRLVGRLDEAITDCQQRLALPEIDSLVVSVEPSINPLRDLLAYIAQQPANSLTASDSPPPDSPRLTSSPPDELKSLSYFRETWSQLSVEQQLAQALAQLPDNAGPLNAHRLILQSLQRMRETAPDHLQRYLSYVDTLLWLEQATNATNPPVKNSGRTEGEPPRPRAKRQK